MTKHPSFIIRQFTPNDTESVVSLWKEAGLTRPWNDPYKDIQRKMYEDPSLFFVGEIDGEVMASALFGYDGHRGWLYYFAISSKYRGHGYASQLMAYGEKELVKRGCPKMHLMVRKDNTSVIGLYEHLGYDPVETVVLGKRLIPDD